MATWSMKRSLLWGCIFDYGERLPSRYRLIGINSPVLRLEKETGLGNLLDYFWLQCPVQYDHDDLHVDTDYTEEMVRHEFKGR